MKEKYKSIVLGAIFSIPIAIGVTWYFHTPTKISRLHLHHMETDCIFASDDPAFQRIKVYHDPGFGRPLLELPNFWRSLFILQNTGDIPICKDDIRKFPYLILSPIQQVVQGIIIEQDPPEGECSLNISRKGDDLEIQIEFDLLQPEEKIVFAVYTVGPGPALTKADARISGLEKFRITEGRSVGLEYLKDLDY